MATASVATTQITTRIEAGNLLELLVEQHSNLIGFEAIGNILGTGVDKFTDTRSLIAAAIEVGRRTAAREILLKFQSKKFCL